MKRLPTGPIIAALTTMALVPALGADPQPSDRVYTITLGPRTACATPKAVRQARADGGTTDVTTPSANTLAMAMSGAVAANAFLGHASAATETFHLEQEFTIDCSDSATCLVRLTMESALVGLVRSKFKAGACARMASARICVPGAAETPLVVVHPPLCVEGDAGRLCNQHLPVIKVDKMPLGRYVLIADFVLTCEAAGLADGHSAADFSPSTSLPVDWVRTRDPFQGVDKKDFGFKVLLTADPPENGKMGGMSARRKDATVKIASLAATRVQPTPTRPRPSPTGLDRHCGPR